ncbi:hypothetical protein [Chroococcus sp. FPU101]|uniref:hypothetical protein n=1 Tax=Chroococcus sp. FPU101 TaxID=1974212 RepID=UPI001A8DEB51|nr:hypothetical protein [Chroococcus sp. FPU101]GFE71519.1 hypothetical protein CFPU101_41290 [Chroococcus sp. FPU101]
MQRLILTSLSVLLISTLQTPSVKAEMTAYKQKMSTTITEVLPFNLVYLGYQGYFTNQGIPSNGAFVAGIHSGRVDAMKLVQVAIERGRLSPETINDQGYLNAVETQLQNFNEN